MASSACDFLGVHVLSCGRHFSGPNDYWTGTATAELAFLCASDGVGNRCFWEFGWRIRWDPRLDPARMVLVWEPGFRVPGSWPLLADPANNRPGLLGDHSVPWFTGPAGFGPRGEHAVAVLLFSTLDSRVLCGWFACPNRFTLHDDRLLALLGSPFVGGGLSRTIYHHHGCLYLCASRCRA